MRIYGHNKTVQNCAKPVSVPFTVIESFSLNNLLLGLAGKRNLVFLTARFFRSQEARSTNCYALKIRKPYNDVASLLNQKVVSARNEAFHDLPILRVILIQAILPLPNPIPVYWPR